MATWIKYYGIWHTILKNSRREGMRWEKTLHQLYGSENTREMI